MTTEQRAEMRLRQLRELVFKALSTAQENDCDQIEEDPEIVTVDMMDRDYDVWMFCRMEHDIEVSDVQPFVEEWQKIQKEKDR